MKKYFWITLLVVLVGAGGWYAYESSRPWWASVPLYEDGLRVRPSGVNDASRVLDPDQFNRERVRRTYQIAKEIPQVLNKLYCWCGCQERGNPPMRSNLECFETRMSVQCGVCQQTALIAWQMYFDGVNDIGRIQYEVDKRFAPDGVKLHSKYAVDS